MKNNCEDCQGTGEIEVESGHFGRYRYDKAKTSLVHDWYGRNDWHKIRCPHLDDSCNE